MYSARLSKHFRSQRVSTSIKMPKSQQYSLWLVTYDSIVIKYEANSSKVLLYGVLLYFTNNWLLAYRAYPVDITSWAFPLSIYYISSVLHYVLSSFDMVTALLCICCQWTFFSISFTQLFPSYQMPKLLSISFFFIVSLIAVVDIVVLCLFHYIYLC